MLNGDAHHWLEADGELRIRPSIRVSKEKNARNIPYMPLTILYAEDHKMVADAIRDTLEAEGWRAVTCTDGAAALNRLASDAHYDLMITDNHLPNVNGLELVRYARGLKHREGLPIVMLSAADCRQEAYGAGVDVFLKKPEGMGRLVETVRELLER